MRHRLTVFFDHRRLQKKHTVANKLAPKWDKTYMLRRRYSYHTVVWRTIENKSKSTQIIRTSRAYYSTMPLFRQSLTHSSNLAFKFPIFAELLALTACQNAILANLKFLHFLRQSNSTKHCKNGNGKYHSSLQHLHALDQTKMTFSNVSQTVENSRHAKSSYWTINPTDHTATH